MSNSSRVGCQAGGGSSGSDSGWGSVGGDGSQGAEGMEKLDLVVENRGNEGMVGLGGAK